MRQKKSYHYCKTENLMVTFPDSYDKFRLQTSKHDFAKGQSEKLEEQM